MSYKKISDLPLVGAPTSGMYVPVVDPAEVSPVNQNKHTLLSSLGSAVTFTQSGTGAVSRSLNSKLQDVISVKDYCALGMETDPPVGLGRRLGRRHPIELAVHWETSLSNS